MNINDIVAKLNEAGHDFTSSKNGFQATSNKDKYYLVVSVVNDDNDDDQEEIELEFTSHETNRTKIKYFGTDVGKLVAYLNSLSLT